MVTISYTFVGHEDRNKRITRQKQSEAASRLLDKMLSDAGIYNYRIERDKNGRPFLATHPNVDFNYSHSEDIVVCVLSVNEGRVGIDVEKNSRRMPEERQKRFIERFFSESEIESRDDLISMWTRKEAYLKYIGTGLSEGFKNTDPMRDKRVRFERIAIGEYTVTVCLERDASLLFKG